MCMAWPASQVVLFENHQGTLPAETMHANAASVTRKLLMNIRKENEEAQKAEEAGWRDRGWRGTSYTGVGGEKEERGGSGRRDVRGVQLELRVSRRGESG